MVVKVALWYELWTSLIDLCWIILLFSDLITEEALIMLHTDETEEAPTRGTHWPVSRRMSFSISYAASLPTPCSAANVSVAPRKTSSWTPTTVTSCPRLWLDSSMIVRTAIKTSPASSVVYAPLLGNIALQHWKCSCLRLQQRPHPMLVLWGWWIPLCHLQSIDLEV
jgi:hypothetical protein